MNQISTCILHRNHNLLGFHCFVFTFLLLKSSVLLQHIALIESLFTKIFVTDSHHLSYLFVEQPCIFVSLVCQYIYASSYKLNYSYLKPIFLIFCIVLYVTRVGLNECAYVNIFIYNNSNLSYTVGHFSSIIYGVYIWTKQPSHPLHLCILNINFIMYRLPFITLIFYCMYKSQMIHSETISAYITTHNQRPRKKLPGLRHLLNNNKVSVCIIFIIITSVLQLGPIKSHHGFK